MKCQTAVLTIVRPATSLLAGYNTIHGAGKDLERGGKKMQEQA